MTHFLGLLPADLVSFSPVALELPHTGRSTFMNHLRWAWIIAMAYVASISTHLWVNAALM